MGRRSWLQIWVLFGAALLAVHDGRYLLGYGEHTQEALARQGHAYLAFAAPVIATGVAAVLAWLLVRATRSPSVSRSTRLRWRTGRVAIACGVAVLVLYVGQETLEGLLSSGHRGGLAGVFGAGGWTAVPLSALAGVVLALAVRIVRDEATLGFAFQLLLSSRAPVTSSAIAREPVTRRRSPLARSGAERAPPLLV